MVSAFSLVYFSAGLQEETVERYADVPLVVVPEGSETRAPASLVDDLQVLDEVAEAVPEVTFPAVLLDSDGTALTNPDSVQGFGHAWTSARLTPLHVVTGEPPSVPNEIVVDHGLAEAGGLTVGMKTDVLVLGEVSDFTISGIAGPAKENDWRHQSAIFFSESYVTGMEDYAPGYVDAIGVLPAAGTNETDLLAAVQALVTDQGGNRYSMLTGDARGPAEGNLSAAEDERFALSTLTLLQLAVVCTIGVVASAIGLSVRGRSKEIAMLRAVGATPWQVRRMVAGEAVLLSAVSLVIGVPLGAALMGLRPDISGILLRNNMSPAFQVHFTAAGILLSIAVVLFSSLVAGLIASRSALRIRPSEAVSEATTQGRELNRGRVVLGGFAVVGTLLGGVALAVFDLPAETLGMFVSVLLVLLAVTASGLLAPWLVGKTTALVRAVANRISRDAPPLSVANVAFYHRRFAGVAGPLLLGITLVGAASTTQMYFNWSYGVQQSVRFTSDLVVTSDLGFSEGARAKIEEVALVTSTATARKTPVEPLVPEPLAHGETAMVLRGDVADTVDLDLVEGRMLAEDGDAVIVAHSFSERNGVRIGDDLAFVLPGNDQEHTLTISGIYGNAGFLDTQMAFGPAVVEALGLRHGAPDGVFVNTVSGADVDTVRAEIGSIFPTEAENAVFAVHDRESMRRVSTEAWAENNRGGTSAIFLMGLFMMFAAVNAISMAQFDRKREFASGRMLGITWRSTYGMVSAEVVMTIFLVFSVAVLATLWIAALITLPTGTDMLSVIPEVIPVDPVTALGGTALVLSLLGTLAAVRGVRRSGD
jgi:putative ABC transport system permease protein